jgi:hypothetical protein
VQQAEDGGAGNLQYLVLEPHQRQCEDLPVRGIEIRMIEDVENFPAKLHVESLRDLRPVKSRGRIEDD